MGLAAIVALAAVAATLLLPLPKAHLLADEWAVSPIVINEILYAPAVETELLEFVELYNAGSTPVHLGGWTLRGGIDFACPQECLIPAGGFLLIGEDPQALEQKYGQPAFGPFRRHLASEGDEVELWDARANLVDAVEYGLGFPWPTAATTPESSIQLLNPRADNSAPGSWRSAPPTPGAANAVLTSSLPPLIEAVAHDPREPRPGEAVLVRARLTQPEEVASARLGLQVVKPGGYIALHDAAFAADWTWQPMSVDADGLVAAVAPALQQDRTLIRYRIEITARNGQKLLLPYADDPQPNFAYFVYAGVPPWSGSIEGGAEGRVAFDFATMPPIPVYHFIAKGADVADALFLPPAPRASGYMGTDYLWRGTLVANGVVHDHVGFRARGGPLRYATGKNHWKLNFWPGHRLQTYDSAGRPHPTPQDKLNLLAVMQRAWTGYRGEQGMFESAGFRLFELAGVPAPATRFIHWRVIDAAAATTPSQYEGDFWGLYLAIEEVDGRFLENHALPDGNLYKTTIGEIDRNNLSRSGPSDNSDLAQLLAAAKDPTRGAAWWRANFDLEGYFSYRAVVEFLHHYDIQDGHNTFYYANPESGRWSLLPWDLDKTWYEGMGGTGEEPFAAPLLSIPEFQIEYQNRLRALRDLLLNPEQIAPLLEELAAAIDSPPQGDSMVDADRARWDYNPLFLTRYVDPGRTWYGAYYAAAADGTFRGIVANMRAFAERRIAYIDSRLLTDRDHPQTSTLHYRGAEGHPADALRFEAGPFADPQGPGTFAAMQWRVAEVTDPLAPAYDPAAPFLFEIESGWESPPLPRYEPAFVPPAGLVLAGRAYRVRLRMMDATGRWSHWSAPYAFVAQPPVAPAQTALQLSEIMYHPAAFGSTPGSGLEFLEFHNPSGATLDLGGMQLAGAVDYRFPVGTRLAPGGYLVLAGNEREFEAFYGKAPLGEFDGRLDNDGEAIELLDAWGRLLWRVEYDDEAPWPREADGGGYALVYDATLGPLDAPAAWRPGAGRGGSPGSADLTLPYHLPYMAR